MRMTLNEKKNDLERRYKTKVLMFKYFNDSTLSKDCNSCSLCYFRKGKWTCSIGLVGKACMNWHKNKLFEKNLIKSIEKLYSESVGDTYGKGNLPAVRS